MRQEEIKNADNEFWCIILIVYSWTSLYAIDRDQKIRLAYNEFAYKNTKNDCKLGDTFQKNGQFAIADT